MGTGELTLRFDVDQEALDTHVSEHPNEYPMVADVDEFTLDDLMEAISLEILTNVEVVGP